MICFTVGDFGLDNPHPETVFQKIRKLHGIFREGKLN